MKNVYNCIIIVLFLLIHRVSLMLITLILNIDQSMKQESVFSKEGKQVSKEAYLLLEKLKKKKEKKDEDTPKSYKEKTPIELF